MTIVRITQARSLAHTEFRLVNDYRPVPMEHFRIAREWADKGLLDPVDTHHLRYIERMMHWMEIQRAAAAACASLTNQVVDEYVARLQGRIATEGNSNGPAVDSSAM